MNLEINWLAVVLAATSTMVVGWVWYMPTVFGKKWMKLSGLKEKEIGVGAGKAIAITVAVSLITAYVLARVTFITNAYFVNSWLQDSLMTAFCVWAGFTATRMLTHDLFARRPAALTFINIAHELVTFMVMGLIIGLLKP